MSRFGASFLDGLDENTRQNISLLCLSVMFLLFVWWRSRENDREGRHEASESSNVSRNRETNIASRSSGADGSPNVAPSPQQQQQRSPLLRALPSSLQSMVGTTTRTLALEASPLLFEFVHSEDVAGKTILQSNHQLLSAVQRLQAVRGVHLLCRVASDGQEEQIKHLLEESGINSTNALFFEMQSSQLHMCRQLVPAIVLSTHGDTINEVQRLMGSTTTAKQVSESQSCLALLNALLPKHHQQVHVPTVKDEQSKGSAFSDGTNLRQRTQAEINS